MGPVDGRSNMGIKGVRSVRLFRALAMVCAVLLACVALTGCGSTMTIGSKDSSQAEFSLTNGLDRGVTAVSVSPAGQDSFAALAQEGELEPGAKATVYCPQTGLVDIKVQTTGGTSYEMHEIDLSALKDATLMNEGDIAFLEYDGTSTLEAEKAYRQAIKDAEEQAKKEAEEKAAAEEAARKAAEEEAAKKAAEEEAAKKAAEEEAARKAAEEEEARKAQEEADRKAAEEAQRQSQNSSKGSSGSGSSSGNSGNSGSSGSGSGSGGGNSGGEDNCADDLLFN